MLERTTMAQTDADSERPMTPVERIQPILDDLMMECFKHGFHQKEMFKRGTFAVVCKCSDTSEIMAIAMSPLRLIVGYSDGYFEENNGKFWKFAIPYDPKTEIPLTEDVLNDID